MNFLQPRTKTFSGSVKRQNGNGSKRVLHTQTSYLDGPLSYQNGRCSALVTLAGLGGIFYLKERFVIMAIYRSQEDLSQPISEVTVSSKPVPDF